MKKITVSLLLILGMLFSFSFIGAATEVETATVAFLQENAGEETTEQQEETTDESESSTENETTDEQEPSSDNETTDEVSSEDETTSEDMTTSEQESATEPVTTDPETTTPTTKPVENPVVKKDIKVYDGSGKVVKTYKIVVDDTSENRRKNMQNALNYCKDNATATNIHTVVLPKGEYAIHYTLNMYSNTVFDLGGSVIYRGGDCGAMIRFGKSSDTVYGYDGYENITIKNGVLDADDTGESSLVRFGHARNVNITDVTFQNSRGVAHLLTFAACDGVRVTGCKFLDMEITSSIKNNNCEAVQIDVLKKEYFEYPAYDGTTAKNIFISDCYFADVQRGVGTHTAIAGHYLDNITIKNNTFENVTGYAIRTLNYTNSEVSGNIIRNCGSGINCGTTPNLELVNFYAPVNSTDVVKKNLNLRIYNNTMNLVNTAQNSTGYGVKVAGAVINNYKDADGKRFTGDCRISGIIVENNTITSNVSKIPFYALYIDGAAGSYFSSASDVAIKNNSVTFNNQSTSYNDIHGVRVDNSTNVYIANNKITDLKSGTKNMGMGIAAAYSYGILVESNNISNVKYCAVKLNITDGATVRKNTVNNTGSSSIYVCGSSKNVNILSNKINNSGSSGIYVSSAQANTIESNNIINAAGHGIYYTTASKGTKVVSNYICNSKKTGINIDSTANVTNILKNTIDISGTAIDGITVAGKASVRKINENKINVRKKKASKALSVKAKFGIRINSKECNIKYISGNTIRSCTNTGIYIAKSATKAKVRKNNIRNVKIGISYKQKKAALKNNTIKKFTKTKIKVTKVKKAKKNNKTQTA